MTLETFFQPDDVQDGYVDWFLLETRLAQAVKTLPPSEAGTANAYVLFLPSGLGVHLGDGDTCTYALGYHSYDGTEPYSVIPYCGSFPVTISHEMAEMSSDPVPNAGWYSEADEEPAGGEVGDLCNFPTSVESYNVSELWSNADGDCEP